MRIEGPPDQAAIRSLRGVIDFWQQNGVWYARGWPRRSTNPPTAGEIAGQESFVCISHWTGRVAPTVRLAYIAQPRSQGQTWVDVYRETAAQRAPTTFIDPSSF